MALHTHACTRGLPHTVAFLIEKTARGFAIILAFAALRTWDMVGCRGCGLAPRPRRPLFGICRLTMVPTGQCYDNGGCFVVAVCGLALRPKRPSFGLLSVRACGLAPRPRRISLGPAWCWYPSRSWQWPRPTIMYGNNSLTSVAFIILNGFVL